MGYENQGVEAIVLDIETAAHAQAADFLEPVSAPANYKDAAKIDAAKRERADKQLAGAALDPAVNRIVAVGWATTRQPDPVVEVCRDETIEACVLEQLWKMVVINTGVRRLITFNGISFDLPTLLTRSSLLGVDAPILNLSKYEKNPNTDLMLRLSHYGLLPYHGLQFWLKRYAIEIPAPPDIVALTGADIPRLVAENTSQSWDLIKAHCELDIRQTLALAKRIGAIS